MSENKKIRLVSSTGDTTTLNLIHSKPYSYVEALKFLRALNKKFRYKVKR